MTLSRTYRVPGGIVGAWIVTLLPLAYALLATIFILWPTDATVSGAGVSRLTYELSQFLPLLFIFLLTVVFYIWGHRQATNQNVVVELRPGEEGEISAAAGE